MGFSEVFYLMDANPELEDMLNNLSEEDVKRHRNVDYDSLFKCYFVYLKGFKNYDDFKKVVVSIRREIVLFEKATKLPMDEYYKELESIDKDYGN